MSNSSCINGAYFLQSSFWLCCRNSFIWCEKTVQYYILWVCAKSVSVISLAALGAKHFADMCDTMLGIWFCCFSTQRLMVRFSCSAETSQLVQVTPAEVMPSTRVFLISSFVPFGSTWEAKLFLLPEHTRCAVAHEIVAPLECCQFLDLIIRTRYCNSGFCEITVQPM